MRIIKIIEEKKHYILLLLASLSFTGLGIFSKVLVENGLSPFGTLFWRSIVAVMTLAVIIKLSKIRFQISGMELKYFVVNAFFSFIAVSTLVISLSLGTDVIKAIAINFSYPIPLIIFSWLWLKEIPSKKDILVTLISILSILLLTEVFTIDSITEFKVGDIFALLSAVGYSLGMIWNRKMRIEIDVNPLKAMFYTFLFVLLLLFMFSTVGDLFAVDYLQPNIKFSLNVESIGAIILLGTLSTVVPTVILSYSAKYVKPFVLGIIMLTEIIWVTIAGIILFNESLSLSEGFGMIGLLISLLLI